MDLSELIAELQNQPADQLVESLPRGEGSLYQAISDRGYDAGLAKGSARTKEIERERDALKADVTRLTEKVATIEQDKPDLEKHNAQWKGRVRELEEKHATELAAKDARIKKAENGNAQATLETKMLAKGLKPLYARVKAKDMGDRILFTEEGKLQTLQKGRDIPLDHDDPLQALADEAYAEAEPDEKLVSVGSGPGLRDATQHQQKPADLYDRARQEVKEKQDARKPQREWKAAVGRA